MVFGALAIAAATASGLLLRSLAKQRRWRRWERERRRELESYCLLEMTLPTYSDPRKRTERAKRVARLVVDQSAFAHCAVFLPDEAGSLVCAGSCGVDDLSLDALDAWCRHCQMEESAPRTHALEGRGEEAPRSFSVELTARGADWGLARPACHRATLVPIRLHRGKLIGLLAVCGSRERRLNAERSAEAVAALELLAAKLARTLERAMLMDRLIHVERLAGAAQLAAGVAEALVEPLHELLDRSELIAGTSNDPRIRDHALVLLASAEGMVETLNTLRDAWRPRVDGAQPIVEPRSG